MLPAHSQLTGEQMLTWKKEAISAGVAIFSKDENDPTSSSADKSVAPIIRPENKF